MRHQHLTILGGLLFLVNSVFALNSPMPMVEDINHQVLEYLKSHQAELKQHPEIVQKTIRQYFIPHVDTQGMSRSVLGRQAWQQASLVEKQAFTQEFTNLVLRTYASLE